ncbi:hypothetical protein GSI_10041 [Ganoderma sinense ZZ0214-1]|uniref:SUN domain-containing protein n=1 Tax=Ganoderma sinense ZZ0214-1 TaxID=1077348 RepID=A0A2G8RZF4_9APHY|nr:hypothetical protein GSI_10041 [Ganoderma sinense ZZ0214-1]
MSPKGIQDLPSDSRPEAALSDDIRIGSCWLVPGSAAQLGLRLSAMIHPTHVSIDHIPFEIAADIGRAPRLMHLWGGVDGDTNEARLDGLSHTSRIAIPQTRLRIGPKVTHGYKFVRLGSFEYDIRSSSHVQTFALEPSFTDSGMYFGVVVLEIASNWGANATCLYRLRVHGDRYEPGQ